MKTTAFKQQLSEMISELNKETGAMLMNIEIDYGTDLENKELVLIDLTLEA